MGSFKLPADKGKAPRWGYLNVTDDYLIGGQDPLMDEKLAQQLEELLKVTPTDDKDKPDPKDPKTTTAPKLKFSENDNLTSSRHLVVMDR